jgi:hypothetical protein
MVIQCGFNNLFANVPHAHNSTDKLSAILYRIIMLSDVEDYPKKLNWTTNITKKRPFGLIGFWDEGNR